MHKTWGKHTASVVTFRCNAPPPFFLSYFFTAGAPLLSFHFISAALRWRARCKMLGIPLRNPPAHTKGKQTNWHTHTLAETVEANKTKMKWVKKRGKEAERNGKQKTENTEKQGKQTQTRQLVCQPSQPESPPCNGLKIKLSPRHELLPSAARSAHPLTVTAALIPTQSHTRNRQLTQIQIRRVKDTLRHTAAC